jgi:crotonobetainyl-CoA:carnitine CoA-transferase CaiB-like acyl-CoA transferase
MSVLAGTVPAAPVLTLPQALDNPYLAETGGILKLAHPARPDGLRMIASPIRVDGERLGATPGPACGADTEAVLGEIGVSAGDIAALRQNGVC